MICPICGKRPAKRFCPAKGERICAICCGTQREQTIDCPPSCAYLIQAHRYEAEHREPLPRDDFPYPDTEFPVEFVYDRWAVITGLANTITRFQTQHREMVDSLVHLALQNLTATYRTLESGIYYEDPPAYPLANQLYRELGSFLREFRTAERNREGFTSLKDSDIFRLLVFLLRICKQESSDRPLSRAFLGFLRERFPLASDAGAEARRIIVP
jgi:hypothetical protein